MSEDLIKRLKSGEADYFLNVEAADALEALKRENEALMEALRPFAKSGELFPEDPGSVEFDQCIYNPAAGRDWSLCGDDLRRARAALSGHAEQGGGNG